MNMISRIFCVFTVGLYLSAAQLGAQTRDVSQFGTLFRQAEAASAAKDLPRAAELWEQVVKGNPVNPRYWQVLANVLYQSKQYRRAIAAYQKLMELGGGAPG